MNRERILRKDKPEDDISLIDYLIYNSSESSSDEELVIDILPPAAPINKALNSTTAHQTRDISSRSPVLFIELSDSSNPPSPVPRLESRSLIRNECNKTSYSNQTESLEKCEILTDFFKCRHYKCTGHLWSKPDLPKNTKSTEQAMKIGCFNSETNTCQLLYPNFKCRRSKCTGHSWNVPEGKVNVPKKTVATQTDESSLKTDKIRFSSQPTAREKKIKRRKNMRSYSPSYYFVGNFLL